VLVARWRGTNRSVDLFYGTYNAATRVATLWRTAPASPTATTCPARSRACRRPASERQRNLGSADGVSMEWPRAVERDRGGTRRRDPLARVVHNAEPGSGSLVGQIDDNLGGCGGCAGGPSSAV